MPHKSIVITNFPDHFRPEDLIMTESNSPGLGAFKNLPPWEVDKPEQPVQDPFPKQEADFKDDYRVSYDIEKAKYTLETDSGVEYEWIPSIQKWTETVCPHYPQTTVSAPADDLSLGWLP